MNINSNIPFVLIDKLHKVAKYFHWGTEIWDKIINSKYYIQNLRILSALNIKIQVLSPK